MFITMNASCPRDYTLHYRLTSWPHAVTHSNCPADTAPTFDRSRRKPASDVASHTGTAAREHLGQDNRPHDPAAAGLVVRHGDRSHPERSVHRSHPAVLLFKLDVG
jgi:hypothetical protein